MNTDKASGQANIQKLKAISDFIQMPVNIGPKQGDRKFSARERQNSTM
jgi:hypothetical protein